MSDSKPLLQQAIDSLSISDIYLTASRAEHAESFYPKARDAFDGLKVQAMHIARRSEIVETDQSDQYLLRIVLGFGVRWVDEETEDAERSEEHTSELQSRGHLVCRLLPERKKSR